MEGEGKVVPEREEGDTGKVGGWGSRWGAEGRRGEGRRKTGGGAESGSEGEHTGGPVNARIMAYKPREAEDELEMAQLHHVGGKDFRVHTMNAERGREVVHDGPGGGRAAI